MGNPFLSEGQENSQVTKKCAFSKSSLEKDSDLNMIQIELEQNKLPAGLDSGASVSIRKFMPVWFINQLMLFQNFLIIPE